MSTDLYHLICILVLAILNVLAKAYRNGLKGFTGATGGSLFFYIIF